MTEAVKQTHIPVGTDRDYVKVRPLSVREREILSALATGAKQAEVAYRLGITVSTIKNTLASAYIKLDVTCAIEAYVVLGWLRVPPDELRAVS